MLSGTQQTTLAAVVGAFAPADADRAAVRALVAAAIEGLPPEKSRRLGYVLSALGSPLAGILLAGRGHGFARLADADRERALRRLARVAVLRPAFDALARLSLFAAYAVDDGAGHSAAWDRIGYPGPRGDVSPAEPLPVEQPPAERLNVDAVVIGSGAGGGVAAALLAQAGLRVVIVEAGHAYETVAARQREAEAFAELYLEAGLCASDDLGVSILAGSCVGGGTTVNWSTSLRLPPGLATQWGDALERPNFTAELADAYDAVESRLAVRLAHDHNRNNRVIVDGCEQLGWPWRAIPRNGDCYNDGCGYCGFGCAYGTKRGTATTYLRDALAAGARLFVDTPAERVLLGPPTLGNGRSVAGVVVRDAGGRNVTIDASLVFVAAGTLRTPGILARSGVESPHLGRHLHLHPTSALAAEFAEPVEAWHGAMQTALCDRFADLGDGFGVTIEAAPAHPGLMALATPWSGRDAHADVMTRARYRATMIALTRDRGEGSVSLDADAGVHYALAAEDGRRLAHGLAGAARIAFAAGAIRVQTLHTDELTLEAADATPAKLDAFAAELQRRATAKAPLALFSAHQMGTARMGARPEQGAIDADGRVYGVAGLYVADASAFPSASGVNPMLTIMALAHRSVSGVIARRAAPPSSGSRERSHS